MDAPHPVSLGGLGYVGVRAPDPVGWRDFATGVCGLEPALMPPGPRQAGIPMPRPDAEGVAEDGTAYLKMDRRQWRFAVHPCAEGEQGLVHGLAQRAAGRTDNAIALGLEHVRQQFHHSREISQD